VELTKPRAAFETLDDGPKASTDKNVRERQFREVARMFSVKAFYQEDKFIESFRLLPKPVHEYAAEPLGIVAGKIFGFASGTNPDTLLIVELLQTKPDEWQWRFAPVQMTSRGVALFHGERKVWSGPNTKARDFTNWGYKFIGR
jgi:hypothetical protein